LQDWKITAVDKFRRGKECKELANRAKCHRHGEGDSWALDRVLCGLPLKCKVDTLRKGDL